MVFDLSKTSKLLIALKFRNYCTIIKTVEGTLAKRTAVQNYRRYSVLSSYGRKTKKKRKREKKTTSRDFSAFVYTYTHTYIYIYMK